MVDDVSKSKLSDELSFYMLSGPGLRSISPDLYKNIVINNSTSKSEKYLMPLSLRAVG